MIASRDLFSYNNIQNQTLILSYLVKIKGHSLLNFQIGYILKFQISNRDFEPLVDLWPRTVKQNHKSLVVSFLHSCKVYKVDTTSAIQSVFKTVAPMRYVISFNYEPNAIHLQNPSMVNYRKFLRKDEAD